MIDLYFYSLLLPLYILPMLYVMNLINKKTVLTLWIAFLSAAITDSFLDNALVSSLVLSAFLVLTILPINGPIFKHRNKHLRVVVLCCDNLKGNCVVTNGNKIYTINFTNGESFHMGDVLMVNNYKNLNEFI